MTSDAVARALEGCPDRLTKIDLEQAPAPVVIAVDRFTEIEREWWKDEWFVSEGIDQAECLLPYGASVVRNSPTLT